MSLRFITGSSGQGKTTFLIDEVIRRSIENPSGQFYVIVPEQFSLEAQRRLAQTHPDHGYMNIDVLSFYRLAYRVFDECGYQPDDILEDLGVSMVLRQILTEHQEDLPELKRNRTQEGFLDELKSVLMEFICYGVGADELMSAGDALTDHPVLLRKCKELARVYDYFEDAIKGRFMVTEQILHVLCDFVADSKILSGAVFYFDGFTGFTPVQLQFLEELLHYAGQVNVTVTINWGCNSQRMLPQEKDGSAQGKMPAEPASSEEDLFHFSEKTVRSLLEICRNSGTQVDDPVCFDHKVPPRFRDNPELALLERSIFRTKRELSQEEPVRIHAVSCFQPEHEAEYILHRIEYLVRREGYRYKDFAILTGSLSEYTAAFERQAELLHIPLFTDTKKKMSYHPSVETLRALFQLVERNYSYESVFRYLKSGMSDLSDEDVDYLENYVIASGVRGYFMWSHPFTRKLRSLSDEEVERLDMLRRQVLKETEAFYLAWKDSNTTVRSRMTALYQQMCHLDYGAKLERMADEEEKKGNYVREKEYREIFSLLVVLLDKIVDVFGEDYLPPRELSELMDTGMESLGLGVVPLSMDQLILGDLKRTRLTDIRILFIAGVNEGIVPPALGEGGLLTDDDKELLKSKGILLAHGPEEQSMEDEFYMYLAFARPKDALYFTWSDVGRDGEARHLSPVLSELRSIFPKLSVKRYPGEEKRYYFNPQDSREYLLRTLSQAVDSPDLSKAQSMLLGYWLENPELRRELETYFAERQRQRNPRLLSGEMAAALYGMELSGSVTRLERYAACPYRYFCTYGLGLFDREEYEVSALDIGNLFHKALEYFSGEVKESDYSWKTMPPEYMEELLDLSVKYAVDDGIQDAINSTARNRYKVNSVRRILDRTVRMIRIHLQDSDFEPDRFEMHFGKMDHLNCAMLPLAGGARMNLEGMIDRVDTYEDGSGVLLRIVDYKSGNTAFDMDDFYHGLQLQLVLYMKAAREMYGKRTGKQVIPAGMYYYELKDPMTRLDKLDEWTLIKKFRMSGYTNSSPEVLDRVEHGTSDFASVNVKINKDGSPSKTSKVLDSEGFYVLEDYVEQKAIALGSRIYEGDIDARPYWKDTKTACAYCGYLTVCGFDPKEGRHYNVLKKHSDEDAYDLIRKQVE